LTGLEDIFWIFQYEFFQRAFLGGICAALLCSVLGVFVVLRRASLIGEGLSHLAFGGIALGLFLAIYPLYAAFAFALLGTLIIYVLNRKKVVYSETAIGLIFSFGLAFGAVLASLAGGFNVDLFSYLFGSILTITNSDLVTIVILTSVVLAFVVVFYKELVHLTFDEQGARLAGIPVMKFELAFNLMVALTVIVSIKIVGSLLVSALLIIPAASAMQFSKSFRGTLLIAMDLGILAVVSGLLVSFAYDVSTGGIIVLLSLAVFVICALVKSISKHRKAKEPEVAHEGVDFIDESLISAEPPR
jgi:zinc transport system permease protein